MSLNSAGFAHCCLLRLGISIPQTGLTCQSVALEVDYSSGKFLVADGGNTATVGRFGGLSRSDPENAAILPASFIEPNGVNASGFLGNLSLGVTSFVVRCRSDSPYVSGPPH